VPHETIVDRDDQLITAGMLADRLRPLVLSSCDQDNPNLSGPSCLSGTPMIPLHRATVGAIYQHLERIADWEGEDTILSLEMKLRGVDHQAAQRRAELEDKLAKRRISGASAIEAASAGETENTGSTEGESAVPQADAQPLDGDHP